MIEQVRLAVRLSELRAGDALMVASVSGRTLQTVELALAARALGVTVIGLTSLEYTAQVESDHPSGQKLCDAAGIVIDNCALSATPASRPRAMSTGCCPSRAWR